MFLRLSYNQINCIHAAAPDFATATESNTIKATTIRSPTSAPEVTKTLARYIVSTSYENLPQKVRKEGVRMLLNWVRVAVGWLKLSD
jgi:hypothetical protein